MQIATVWSHVSETVFAAVGQKVGSAVRDEVQYEVQAEVMAKVQYGVQPDGLDEIWHRIGEALEDM